MNLFYNPGGCSLASHIAIVETGMPCQLVTVNREKRTSDGRDFMRINPKGFIPALELDDGTVLAESLVHLAGRSAPISTALTRRAACRSWST